MFDAKGLMILSHFSGKSSTLYLLSSAVLASVSEQGQAPYIFYGTGKQKPLSYTTAKIVFTGKLVSKELSSKTIFLSSAVLASVSEQGQLYL